MRHNYIPVGKPNYNGDVESFHGRIQDEFYEREDFSRGDLEGVPYMYMTILIIFSGRILIKGVRARGRQ